MFYTPYRLKTLFFPVPVLDSMFNFSIYIEIWETSDKEVFFLPAKAVFLHAVYARRSKRFSCAPLIVATALPISTQNTFFSRAILSGTHFEQVLDFFFALINVSYLTEKGDRGSHIFLQQ